MEITDVATNKRPSDLHQCSAHRLADMNTTQLRFFPPCRAKSLLFVRMKWNNVNLHCICVNKQSGVGGGDDPFMTLRKKCLLCLSKQQSLRENGIRFT